MVSVSFFFSGFVGFVDGVVACHDFECLFIYF